MKKVALLIIVLFAVASLLVGCSAPENETVQEKVEEMTGVDARFIIIDEEAIVRPGFIGSSRVYIMVDKNTKIMYLFSDDSKYFSGLSPLYDEDGKPMKYTGDLSEFN